MRRLGGGVEERFRSRGLVSARRAVREAKIKKGETKPICLNITPPMSGPKACPMLWAAM